VSVQVDLPADIAAVYPYVNAQLTGCAYNHAGQTLSWAEGRHKIVLRSRSLAVSQLPDWESAAAAAGRLVEFLNDVWAQRAQLQPRLEPWPQAAPLALLRQLPATNCRACGQATCYQFALQLMARQVTPEQCSPLGEPDLAERRAVLKEMLVSPPRVLFPDLG
jgi:ArsR family metal-binding transcriptional regulator